MTYFRVCIYTLLLFFFASTTAYSSDSFTESARTNDLAPQAEVLSSGTSGFHGPREAADGLLESYWNTNGTADKPDWIEFTWKQPVTIRELVVRRYEADRGTRDLSRLKVEQFENGAWHLVTELGNGKDALPRIVYERVRAQGVEQLRISGFDAKMQIREIGLYSEETAPFMDVRGDDRGNIVGVLTDGFGSKGLAAEVRATGQAGGKAWKASAKTGARGAFTIPLPVGLTGKVEFTAKVNGATVRKVVGAGDILAGLTPRAGNTLELDGTWKFMLDPPQGFEGTDFDDSAWKPIQVPAHWVMQGFAPKEYGGYRRHITLPADWKGQRVRIAFDGVYSGAEVWWNGQRVGSHVGGATSFQLDVTAAAHPGDNVVAVRVAKETITANLDHMSMYADFPLAGIYRRAYVFSVPPVHVQRAQSHAEFDPDFKNADLITEISVVNESRSAARHTSLQLTLSRGGQTVATSNPVTLDLPAWSQKTETIRMKVADPSKWNAEHPELYTLRTALTRNGEALEQIERNVGFRDTRIQGTDLLIDGKPVKLMGTTHHDSDPVLGRAVTPALERQDLDLMKEANINAVRTSHYPPIPELDNLADEIGVYVEEEAPYCWVDQAYDLRLGALARQVTSEMVERDMSHPSVSYWSAGNESSWGPILDEGAEEIRSHDPSRPVMGSYDDDLDFIIRHNPTTVAEIESLNKEAKKPVLWDESLAIFQGIFGGGESLWRDPGYRDYYGTAMIGVMDALWKSKVVQGTFIWSWADDLFLVPNRGSEYGRNFVESHGVDRIYHKDGAGLTGDAPWGVVDGWRRKKPEFWHIKKLYSPIHVEATKLALPTSGVVKIPVENRYDFTNLSELSIEWRLGDEHGVVKPDIAPRTTGNIEIPIAAVKPGDHLEVRFLHGKDLVDIESIQLGEAPEVAAAPEHHAPLQIHQQELLSNLSPRIDGDDFSLGISGRRKLIQYFETGGTPILYDQPQIHVLPIRDPVSFPATDHWTLESPAEITENDGAVTIVDHGHYPNLKGSYTTVITPDGDVTITSEFIYTGPEVSATEVGMKLEVPLALDHLTWKRKGDWTWYPSDHIGALQGSVTAHSGKPGFVVPKWPYAEDDSPMGSNMYRSTKRGLLRATVTNDAGQGWEILSDGSQNLRASVGTDRITVYVSDFYGGAPDDLYEFVVNYGNGKVLHSGDHLHSVLRLHRLNGKEKSE